MRYDTAGNKIWEPISCDCGLTGGCEKCNPPLFTKENQELRREYYPFLEDEISPETERNFYKQVFKWGGK